MISISDCADSFIYAHQATKNILKTYRPLGSNAKSPPIQQPRGLQTSTIDLSTGEIVQAKPEYCPSTVRLERFALQSSVRHLLPDSRTAKCLRIRQANKDVEVWRSSDHGTARYAGLQTCSSVWACPVCAAKISERRRVELLHAIQKHEGSGDQVLLLTLTNPHTKTDDLDAMLKAQALAMSRFTSTRAGRTVLKYMSCIGMVRAWEITHGNNNGWHPHFHILLFVRSGLDIKAFQSLLYDVWANCCRLAKLSIPSPLHGVRLEDGAKASQYVTKGMWGLDREMTKGHIKKAAKGGRSPFDLLRLYLNDKDKQAGALFIEYAKAFKGKRQLTWSPGLKQHFSVAEMTDQETAAKVDDDAYLLGKINIDQWRAVRRFNLRGEVLELARYGWDAVSLLLSQLTENDKQLCQRKPPS